jgi:glycosyltransferase involved in cell wall biosynthesis
MKIAYIYPEKLPSKKTRTISVINTSCELSKIVDTTLIYEKSGKNILEFYGVNCNLKLKPLSKKFLIRSNKIFNFNLKKEIKNYDYFYIRHLKIAQFLIKNGAKIIFEAHEIFSNTNRKVKEIEKFVLKNSFALTFINKSLQKEINKNFETTQFQKVIHNGTNFKTKFIKKDFSKIDEIYYIGSFQKWKGVDFLIDAVKNLNIKLKIVGEGERKEELKEKANKNVEFLGYKSQTEIQNILKNSKLTIIPNINSSYNNFSSPIKLYEYLITSNVVLAVNFNPIKEIIKDGKNGFLFEAGNKESFLNKLNYILNLDKKELEKISQKAYETGKKFTWENRAKEIVKFSKELNAKNNLSSS